MRSTSKEIKSMIGQMIMTGFRGTSAEDAASFFQSLDGLTVGGLLLYDQNVTTNPPTLHNIRSPEQVQSLNAALQTFSEIPLFIGVDQEGGQVNRLKKEYGFNDSQSWENIGIEGSESNTIDHAKKIAFTLKTHGFNMNFAPVLDLPINSDNVIVQKGRCFSHDPEVVARHAELFINAHLEHNVIPVCKHFPGQGSAASDTHDGFVNVSDSWAESELFPYEYLIDNHSIPAVMTSHLFHQALDSKYPATLSSKILKQMLRKQMGFNGVIISDDPQMGAITDHYELKTVINLMVNAGVDIFCFGNNLVYDPDIVKKVYAIMDELLKEGLITAQQIETSYNRILRLKELIGLS